MKNKVIPIACGIALFSMHIFPSGNLGLAIGILCALIAAERHFS